MSQSERRKIGILTQPVGHNYGGVLQNYALNKVLRNNGYLSYTINYGRKPTLVGFALRYMSAKLSGRGGELPLSPRKSERKKFPLLPFVYARIPVTMPRMRRVSRLPLCRYGFDTIIVGSDQVWRPSYNSNIEDMYLDFIHSRKIRKIAYAASFGVDTWEYSPEQTQKCAALAARFGAISVREDSAVKLCRENLQSEAVRVLDPTLLLRREDYLDLCGNIRGGSGTKLFAYILDKSSGKEELIRKFATERGLELSLMGPSEADGAESVEIWIAEFRDAEAVITDSFHGCVFSIIFHKDFHVIDNSGRGSARFDSLLNILGLQDRMIRDSDTLVQDSIDWKRVDERLELERRKSLDWLLGALER